MSRGQPVSYESIAASVVVWLTANFKFLSPPNACCGRFAFSGSHATPKNSNSNRNDRLKIVHSGGLVGRELIG